jgi:hypothetical protein
MCRLATLEIKASLPKTFLSPSKGAPSIGLRCLLSENIHHILKVWRQLPFRQISKFNFVISPFTSSSNHAMSLENNTIPTTQCPPHPPYAHLTFNTLWLYRWDSLITFLILSSSSRVRWNTLRESQCLMSRKTSHAKLRLLYTSHERHLF